jgi:hypothetical protein
VTDADARDRHDLDVVEQAIEELYIERGYGVFSAEQRQRYDSLLQREEELRGQLGLPTKDRGGRP